MTKAAEKPRAKAKPKAKQPTNAELMAAIARLTTQVSDLAAKLADVESRVNTGLEQTRTEAAGRAESSRLQDRVNKGVSDAVFGDGKPGVIADTLTNTNAIEMIVPSLKEVKDTIANINSTAIRSFFGLVAAVILLAIDIVIRTGILSGIPK